MLGCPENRTAHASGGPKGKSPKGQKGVAQAEAAGLAPAAYGQSPPAPLPSASAKDGSWNMVIGGVIAGLALIAAGLVIYLLVNKTSDTTALPVPATTTTTQPFRPPQENQVAIAERIDAVIADSQRGRSIVGTGDWQGAMQARTETLGSIEAISGAHGGLAEAQRLLQIALQRSLDADRAHMSMNSADVPEDAAATAAKQAFVSVWNPIAERHGLTTYTSDGI